jgi:deoxyhypusine synthase
LVAEGFAAALQQCGPPLTRVKHPLMATVKDYLLHTFRHFNAGILVRAAQAWKEHVDRGGSMLLTMGGAMSTAEIGVVLAELIREDWVHALCVTGANLEEDVFNLVAHDDYVRIEDFRALSAEQETELLKQGLNRVTDTCIPEAAAMQKVEQQVLKVWQAAESAGERLMPHECLYRVLRSRVLEQQYQIDPAHSWLLAACEKDLPVFVPGWEDSTLGNILVADVRAGKVGRFDVIKSGLEQMSALVDWYLEQDADRRVGFFQIGGGITGDFAVCTVPLIIQDLKQRCRMWAYFCQISESTTSYGSYSGAPPNEKITWGKLDASTPRFVVESDATIVFPLIAAYLLDR